MIFYIKYLDGKTDTVDAEEWTVEGRSVNFYRYNKLNTRYMSHIVNLAAVRIIEKGAAEKQV
jgi:hypothetical protein